MQTPPSRLCIAKSKFSMKRVPIKGGARKGEFKMISAQANLLINFIIKAFEAFVKEKILAGVKADDFFAAFGLIRT